MKIAIVVPCYNEELVLGETSTRLLDVCQRLRQRYDDVTTSILFIDDGSRDNTWQLITELSQKESTIGGLKLSHNSGHQRALWAGLEWASQNVDAAISIDADLQDDVEAILEMVEKFRQGTDIVFGVRKERATDTFMKKHTAQFFYKMMHALGTEVVYNHADYRLMSNRALKALMQFPEQNLFLRGMVKSLGFRQDNVYYDRAERFAGESKYPLSKMMGLALDGITSFSNRPLGLIVLLGLIFMFISVIAIIYAIVSYIVGNVMPGWTSLLISVWFIGGAILTAIGIIGEYIGKIYSEVKSRPRYLLDEVISPEEKK